MQGCVVKTVRQLEEANKFRKHPRIVVEGKLASNIMASGILKSLENGGRTMWQVIPGRRDAEPSPINEVIRLLNEVASRCTIDVIAQAEKLQIAIYPEPVLRREGN